MVFLLSGLVFPIVFLVDFSLGVKQLIASMGIGIGYVAVAFIMFSRYVRRLTRSPKTGMVLFHVFSTRAQEFILVSESYGKKGYSSDSSSTDNAARTGFSSSENQTLPSNAQKGSLSSAESLARPTNIDVVEVFHRHSIC